MIYTKPDREMIRYFPFRTPCFESVLFTCLVCIFLHDFTCLITRAKTGILQGDFRVKKFVILLKIKRLLFTYNIKLLYICSVRNN